MLHLPDSRQFLKLPLVLLVSFLIIIFSPLGLFLSFPLFLLRYLISKSSRLLRPDLGKMLTTRGTLFASDNFTTTPHGNILLSVTLQGKLDLDKFKDIVQHNVLDYRPKYLKGELKYPEFRQYLTKWCGYLFWKDDKQFDLNYHMKLYKNPNPGSKVSSSELEKLRQELITKKWEERRPLWDHLVVHNASPNLKYGTSLGPESPSQGLEITVLFVRCHHSLGDGNTWRHLIRTRLCCVPEHKNSPAKSDWKSFFLQTLFVLSLPIRGAYEVAEFVLSPIILKDQLPFRQMKNKKTLNSKRDFNIDLCERTSIKVINEIKNHFGVSFFSVILAILTGALREFMINNGYNVPKSVRMLTPLPLSGHSYKLRNFMSAWYVSLPVGEEDALRRLRRCHKSCEKIRRSTGPIFFKYSMPFCGAYFTRLTKLLTKNRSASLVISNFPLALENLTMNGHLCLEAFFTLGPQHGIQGVGFCGMSYADGYRISPFGVASAISREELRELTCLIQKHTQLLLNCTKVLEV